MSFYLNHSIIESFSNALHGLTSEISVLTIHHRSGAITVLFIGAVVQLILCYAFYNLFLHPLRRYPGPFLWRASRLPYVFSMHKGELHRCMKSFHDRYGPIVRIAPNELSYIDGRAWKDIYGNRPGHSLFERNPTWFRPIRAGEPQSIMGWDEEYHARYRKSFSQAFSEKSLKDQAPVIEKFVEAWIQQLRRLSGSSKAPALDMAQWFDLLTFDISGDLSFGESFDCVKNGEAHPWVEIAHDFGKGLALISSINQYPPLDRLLKYILPKKIIQRQLDHRAMSQAKIRKRLALDTDRPDFVTATKKYSDEKGTMTTEDWDLNMTILIFAGSETTAAALSGILRLLLQNRGVMHILVREIRNAFENQSQITVGSTGNLNYMNAVISEGLRLCPPNVIGIPRISPPGGDMVCGQFVPEGTYVAFNQFAAYRSPANFQYPNSFIPERFLQSYKDDMSSFRPFAVGRHSCLGMKLAYAELRLVLARLLFAFDISLADAKERWDWGNQQTFIFWQKGPLRVNLRQANQR